MIDVGSCIFDADVYHSVIVGSSSILFSFD